MKRANTCLLRLTDVALDTPGGRPLFRGLSLVIERTDRLALVGRNGVGKSSLLALLAGSAQAHGGDIACYGRRELVPQVIERTAAGMSPGELRRQRLQHAFDAHPDLLLLDEPTHDLDELNLRWLLTRLEQWEQALVVVSHDERLLSKFDDFAVACESGCGHFRGGFDALMRKLERDRDDSEQRYARNLNRLLDREERSAVVRQRRQRKKNLGRIHEIKRCPARAKLNDKRSYAQESQGKRAVLQRARLDAARDWARATRRALAVRLPLELILPQLPDDLGPPVVALDHVSVFAGSRALCRELSLHVRRERVAITGPNGSGKTTLLEVLVGQRAPTHGVARCDPSRFGYVAQDARNWCVHDSLLDHLNGGTIETSASVLEAHGFPLALAQRSLLSLSPGERMRAALISLCSRRPAPELLVLDEPTDHLDFVGKGSLEAVLRAWPGGLVVTSHDQSFLRTIGIHRTLALEA